MERLLRQPTHLFNALLSTGVQCVVSIILLEGACPSLRQAFTPLNASVNPSNIWWAGMLHAHQSSMGEGGGDLDTQLECQRYKRQHQEASNWKSGRRGPLDFKWWYKRCAYGYLAPTNPPTQCVLMNLFHCLGESRRKEKQILKPTDQCWSTKCFRHPESWAAQL